MFGKNKISKVDHGDGLSLFINEIFPTIQGEGPFTGTPAIFIRLAGCSLKCFWCDTQFDEPNTLLSLDDILQKLKVIKNNFPEIRLVVLTGGEPMRQNIVPLIRRIFEMFSGEDTYIQIETAGTVWIPGLEDLVIKRIVGPKPRVSIVCSPKTGKVNSELAKHVSAWKYILREDEISPLDGLPIVSTQIPGVVCELQRPTNSAPIYIQPCDEHDDEVTRKNVEMAVAVSMKHGYKISVQVHKVLDVR